jgi:predicted ATPase
LHRLLFRSRLLSLTGSGGVGKTRLAIRLAADFTNELAGGVWFVDLASLAAPALISQAVAVVFGVRESPQRSVREALVDWLQDRELLLLLDTCEHLIDGCAELAEALLRAAPALRIVVTSREALGLPGETVYRVPPLSLPEPSTSCSPQMLDDFEATALFVERATAIQPDFEVHRDATGPITAICRRLDGIPLAIELAAAQVALLSPEQIEARLSAGVPTTTGSRTSVARQRTLDATVDWSYQRLSESEQLLFGRLSIFPASWTLETAEHVCGGDGIDPAHFYRGSSASRWSMSGALAMTPLGIDSSKPSASMRMRGSLRPPPSAICATAISRSFIASSATACTPSAAPMRRPV